MSKQVPIKIHGVKFGTAEPVTACLLYLLLVPALLLLYGWLFMLAVGVLGLSLGFWSSVAASSLLRFWWPTSTSS